MSMMGEHIPQRAGGTPEGRQQGPEDSDDEVDGGQLWDAQHQVGYLGLEGEFGGELSPQPSSSAECEHRVSPLDPNLSSAARYSPPPPYSSPMTGIEASLDHPDSPMEDLSHSSSLPIIPTGVSSSISSATGSLVHSESHRLPLPHSSARQISGSRTSSFVSPNSLFITQSSLSQSQPRWATHNVISDDENDDDDDESEPPVLSESVWVKQKRLALRSIVENEASQAGPSGLQSVTPSNRSVFMNNPQPGPSGVQAVLQPSSSCIQNRSHTGSSGLRNLPQPSPSNLDALPSTNKIPNRRHESDSSDSDDGDHDSSEGLPQLCPSLSSRMRGRVVHLSDGEAEALSGPTSGCEASSSMRGHVTPLSSPSTPADNCIVSSSTGHIDSIPPTPAEFQGNDVSGPCSPVSPSLASAAILDSTVDSTSGREIINTKGQSSDDESDEDNLAASGIELPVMVDAAEEISTSEVDLQHSDDSQEVALLVNPQRMFASERGSASRFIEHLSLSLSHFPGNSLDPGISSIVNEHRTDSNTLAPSEPGPYLGDPLSTPGPSRVALPCSSQPGTSQADTPAHQNRDQPSISSTHSIPDAVEVLDSSLPLLDIASGLSECSTVSHGDHLGNDAQSQTLEGAVVRIENESNDIAENQDEIDPLVSFADTVNDSVNNENLAADSGNQDFNQLTPSYVLHLADESSAGSEDALSSASCDKDELTSVSTKKGSYQSPVTSHQSLLEAETVTGDSLDNSLGISLTSSQPRKELESDVSLPGTSQQQTLTQQLITSQGNQVSLLVGGSDDSNDGALLMMVTSHPSSLQNIVAHDKSLEKEESGSLLPCLDAPSPQNVSCDEKEAPPASVSSEETTSPKQNVITTTASHKDVEVEFIGADFWCGECGHMYVHECPTHHVQDSEKSGRTRAWMSNSAQEVTSHKASDADGCVDCEQEDDHECPQHHVQAISDKPVQTRAWASLPGQHLAIRKVTGTEEFGVFTRKVIPKRTRFGPLEGIMMDDPRDILPSTGLIYSVLIGEKTFFLDISDEGSSNWMRFVRKATSYLEQNCVVMQIEGSLVFLTSTDILPRTELRVGYSKQYASQRNLHSLEPTQQEISVLESMRKSWPCYECDEGFESSAELQQHLTCHDVAAGDEERKKRKRLKSRRPRANGDAETSTKKMVKRIKTSGEEASSAGSSQIGRVLLQANGEEGPLHHMCKICNRAFTKAEVLKIHVISHQTVEIKEEDDGISLKQENRTCPQCFKNFESEMELSFHVEEHSLCLPLSTKPYKCEFCYKSFLRQDSLQAHSAVHSNEAEKPFRCNLCLRRFCNNSALKTHVKFHIGSKGYDCPICREGFFSVASLKAHVSTHCVNEQYKCPTCNKVFPTYSKIRRHIRSYHAILPHTCSICSKEMPSTDKLKIHMLSHSDRRDYLCQDCGKRFKRKDKMREHSKRMHSSDRDARASKVATKAPPKFVPKVDPTDYMQFEYKCHTCLLGFKRRGMLVNHLAKRHPNVDMTSVPELNQPILKATRCYYCQYCEKMYRSSSKRKLHILKYHPGEELPPSSTSHKESTSGEDSTYSQTVGAITTYPHPCKWCYRQYASRARLLRHQRHQHPDINDDSPFMKEYGKDAAEPGVGDIDPLLDDSAGISGELPLRDQIVESNLMQNPRLSRGEPSTSGVQGPEDDLLTQAMGEITPLGNGDQYVRLIGTGTEGQPVMVGTTQANRSLLMSNDGGQQGATLALVTTDNADTVTLSLPAGQFISLIPGLSVSGAASVVTPDTRAASSGRESARIEGVAAQEDNRAASQELQREILSTIRMGPSLSKEESVEQVVLTAHQSPSLSNSVVWQQALSFTNTTT
ncbi:uncharacterized protein LOC135107593 isoform X2 [Scylla paramamosain]|uniref:uncharacterized protein LOC135107593 isoform X2 n=1 Tax=Scylla paramamosain TaxID=85552 RepID=UPI003082EC3D